MPSRRRGQPGCGHGLRAEASAVGPLRADPEELLDLPDGFEYRVVSRAGDTMADGFQVPPAHDGMAAFEGRDGRIILICNHEMPPSYPEYSAFGNVFRHRARTRYGSGSTTMAAARRPGAGGTTTTVYDPASGKTERQHLSLAGHRAQLRGRTDALGQLAVLRGVLRASRDRYS